MSDSLFQIGKSQSGESSGQHRPDWLRIRLSTPRRYHEVERLVEGLSLNTVCKEARCPNIYECWGEHGTATFMILGDICTRRCGFCAVTSGRPRPGVEEDEPEFKYVSTMHGNEPVGMELCMNLLELIAGDMEVVNDNKFFLEPLGDQDFKLRIKLCF